MIRLGFLLAVASAGSLLPASDTGSDVVYRSDVSLVRVDAQVVDRDNRAVTGLTERDFVLREDGRPQQIRNFASENMPLDVLMLLDVSASMRPHVQRIASAAHDALRVLGADDRVAIMVFDRTTRVRMPFRSSRSDVDKEFEALLRHETFHGGTDITRGLLDAADYIGRQGRRDARRAIVIVTDDQTERDRDEEAVSRALTRADAVLSALIAPDAMQYRTRGGHGGGGGGSWPGGGPSIGGPLGGIILGRRGSGGGRGPGGGGPGMGGPHTQSAGTEEIARRSGGDSMPVDDSSSLESTLERLRQRYALHFHLPQGVKPGEERQVEVALSDTALQRHPGAEVRYRREYITPSTVASAGDATPEPAVIGQAPATGSGSNTDVPSSAPRRRTAVNGPITEGPSIGGASSSTSTDSEPATPAPATQPAAQPAPAPAPANGADQDTPHGWRRVKPADQP
jgi:VWFA-related protein